MVSLQICRFATKLNKRKRLDNTKTIHWFVYEEEDRMRERHCHPEDEENTEGKGEERVRRCGEELEEDAENVEDLIMYI